MSDDQLPSKSKPPVATGRTSSRSKSLTPEQRRFMGRPRIKEEQETVEEPPVAAVKELTSPEPATLENEEGIVAVSEPETEDSERATEPTRPRRASQPAGAVRANQKTARVSEMQLPFLLLGGAVILFGTFYVGKKFDYWRSVVQSSRSAPKELNQVEDKFPTLSADELVVQALLAERRGDRQDAAERLIAAKHKNLDYRGILFHVGKLAYDAGDFDGAGKLFERAVAFGEDPATANYFRGLIAIRHSDLAAAERFFEAAATSDPFTAQYHYYLAEALRIDHHPNEAIPRYERARLLASSEQDATVAQFKIRMAQIEAGDAPKVAAQLAERQGEGNLSADWLMTAAALDIVHGQLDDALPLIAQARAAQQPGIFKAGVEDAFFANAAAKNPAITAAVQEPDEKAAIVP